MYVVLCRVAEHSDSNKMDAHNLAVVFGPTLLRIPSEQDMIAYQSQVNGMMELLIKHCAEVFPGSVEPLHARLSETEESDSEEGIAGSNVSLEKKKDLEKIVRMDHFLVLGFGLEFACIYLMREINIFLMISPPC